MSEMDETFEKMVGMLEEARRAVQGYLDQPAISETRDGLALTKLREAVRNFANQADALFMMMIERNVPDPLTDRAEELVKFVQVAHAQNVTLLQPEQG